MKKTLLALAALLALGIGAAAQDTIPMNGLTREGYLYNDYYSRFKNSTLSQLDDVCDGGEWGIRFYSSDTLAIYGIAVGIRDGREYYESQGLNPANYMHDTSYEHAYEYLRIYEPYPDSLHCTHQVKLHLHRHPVAYYAYYSDTIPTRPRDFVAMYERYFNAPVNVSGVFYVGKTFFNGARYGTIEDTYIPLMLRLLRYTTAQFGDSVMYGHNEPTLYWMRQWMRGKNYLIFPILLPPDTNYVWDTTVVAGDTTFVGDTVIVCDTLIVGGDTIIHYDTILALPEHGLLGRLTGVMPNPAAETAKVVSSYGLTEVEVFNMAGEKVHTLRLPDAPLTATLDVRRWPSGTYLLRIHTPQGTAVKKLVVR